MKKILFSVTGIVLVATLVLAACASKTGPTTGGTNPSGNGGGNGGAGFTNRPLPLVGQLLVGTFKLEGTTNAVDANEATQLLPLWQAYSQLLTSNTTAQEEVDAVVSQIQTTMTPAQVQAITAMKLTTQDEFSLMSTLGLGFRGSGTPGFNGTPGFRGTPRAGGGGGGFPGGGGGFAGGGGGGFPGGGGGFAGGGGGFTGGGGGFNATQIATLRAQRTRTADFGNLPTPLLREMISLLQKKAGVSPTATPTPAS